MLIIISWTFVIDIVLKDIETRVQQEHDYDNNGDEWNNIEKLCFELTWIFFFLGKIKMVLDTIKIINNSAAKIIVRCANNLVVIENVMDAQRYKFKVRGRLRRRLNK